ncbi:3-methyladenine DNA glycosylase [Candidatus Berkelbacteria bacterium CG11_big_fil_rev_8_21_14_0_20_42_15]|uniref:Putative 3-methyladenine DNA glycosylase n=2 Tax=Candidatus Berkelbacteria TaxID=1618330 RepID=A0A2M7K1K5_9BACT|nr:MAG: 3-methyladenine DNA glycosylase [Candidatus Berkelbacteria bacterium CG11_big_fil_rev_8_21_14_0_20_42_15]PIX30115.1 MAG: DNA-3-methyladenine glycosylase [Candidatus Berkelbacteria bacterium CG_4_8_14_3_um_filter_42_13]
MKLKREFFERDTLEVARDLLGKIIVREIGERIIKARIIETEAYCGVEDKACHARHGKTKRNAPMWGPAGFTYVYLCMGLHNLLNIVTGEKDQPEAVLIRGIIPLTGTSKKFKSYGPGNLTKYLKINRGLNNHDTIYSRQLWFEDDEFAIALKNITSAPRIGISYAAEYRHKPWRFTLKI